MTDHDIAALYPLSPAQEGILFHARLAAEESQNGVYVQQLRCTIVGALDPALFARAWAWLTERHEALRSCFLWDDVDAPLWVIHTRAETPLRVVGEGELLAEGDLQRLADEDRRAGFDLTQAPLSRLLLVAQGKDRWALVWTQHHLILDGWSLPVIMNELLVSYGALAKGQTPNLPSAPSLRGYAEWLREEQKRQATHLAYFREQLHDVARPSPLPCTRRTPSPRPAQSHESVRTGCSAEETKALHAFAKARGVTLATLVSAAWAIVLSRHDPSGDDAVFGITFAGRPPEVRDAERMVGMFINTLPLRAPTGPGVTVDALLHSVARALLELQLRASTPLALAAKASAVPTGQVLIETLVVVENYPEAAALEGVAIRVASIETAERINFPLSLVVNGGSLLSLSLLFDGDRFAFEHLQGLLAQVKHVLLSMGADPTREIRHIPLLSAAQAEATRLLRSVRQPSPTRGSLQAAFRATALARGNAVALRHGGQSLSYGELLLRVQAIAQDLRARGVAPGHRVAICVTPGFDMVASVLGVLWVGAAYVPTDPRHPAARRKLIADDAGAAVLLHDDDAMAMEGARCIDVRSLPSTLEGEQSVMHDGEPSDAAYVLYTSGSTGLPKGVLISHHNVLRLFSATQPWFQLGPGDAFTLFHSLAFDFSVWELFGALLHGGRLVIVPPTQTRLFDEVRALIHREQITVFSQTPSAFEQFMRADEASREPLSLRLVVFGGEALWPSRLGPWFERHGLSGPTLVNMYGITETTVHVTYRVITAADVAVPTFVTASPIGVPIPDLALRVADAQGHEVPDFVPGELLVGGDGVSEGYPQLPDVTRARFFTDDTGLRWYRSGDRGRSVPGHGYEFLGRIDAQLKIRGHRIEPGEIEAALRTHERVAAAAITPTTRYGAPELVAYVVPKAPAGATEDDLPAALRAHLAARLPEPFVPRDIVLVSALPLTANGKLDVARLSALLVASAPGAHGPQTEAPAPQGSMALELVTATLQRALGAASLGPDDDIFRLGAHSLVVAQAAFRLRAQLGVDLPLRALFEHRTPRALAAYAESRAKAPLPPMQRVTSEPTAPLSFAQRRLWFLDRLGQSSDPLHHQRSLYNVTLAVKVEGPLDVERLRLALAAVSARHEVMRTTFEDGPDGPQQRVHESLEVPLTERDEHADTFPAVANAYSALPFDLSRGPLARALVLHQPGAATHWLVLSMHHIVTDGWSMGLLLRELLAHYEGNAAALPALPLQYKDFARWQASLPSTRIAADLDYFRDQLADLPAVIDLGADHPRPSVPSYRARELTFDIDETEGRRLAEVAAGLGVTPAMFLLAVLHLLLAQRSGQAAPCIGVSIAGRGQPELDGLLGFFVNVLPVRAPVLPNATFRELAEAVREACLGAYARDHVPFEDIAQAVGHARSLSHAPVFQVNFVHQGFNVSDLWERDAHKGPRATPVVLGSSTVRFDLVLTAEPRPGGAHHFTLTAATDLFDEGTQAQLAHQYLALLREALREVDEDEETWALSLHRRALPPGPMRRVEPALTIESLPALFVAQAHERPDAPALLHGDQVLGFGALEARARKIAALLAQDGVRPGTRVAICMHPGVLRVAALLGAWCQGAAFVPVDPELPLHRRALLISKAGASVVLADADTEDDLPSDLLVPVRRITEEELLPAAPKASWYPSGPDDVAYLLFTSGSTGAPKGVLVPHRGIGNLALAQGRLCGLHAEDRVLAFASFAFDAHISELGLALAHGAALDLGLRGVSPRQAPLRTLREREATVVTLPPSLLRVLDPGTEGGLPHLRVLLAAGEALYGDALEKWVHPKRRIWNAYGPTEITVCATMYAVPEIVAAQGGRVPIGRPLAGVSAFVADASGAPVPQGFVGELRVLGVGVAQGYLDGDQSGFFSQHDGAQALRGYATGDVVRERPDGNFEYLGRNDDQVKVRGIRIELSEVERTLEAHSLVCEAAARVVDERTPRERLVAYVVPATTASEGMQAQLLSYARLHLPAAAVPSAIVMLTSLPRGVSGKVQRSALPVPDLADATSGDAPDEPPAPGLETAVAQVWQEALGAKSIGRHSDFFALGGHSLLALQVAARLSSNLGVQVPLRVFFEHTTLAAFAQTLGPAQATAATTRAQPLPRASRDGALPLSFAEERLWFLEQLQPGTSAYVLSAAFRLRGAVDLRRLARALDAVAMRHEALRTTYPAEAGVPRRQLAPQADLKLGLHALDTGPEAEATRVAQAIETDARSPFDLAKGPLARVRLLTLAKDHHVLSVAIHHMLADAAAMAQLVRDLGAAYAGAQLPPLTRDYADFAAWERTLERTNVRRQRLAAAEQRLHDAPAFTTLPADREVRKVPAGPAGRVRAQLPKPLTAALAERPGHKTLTPFMAATAALALVIHRFGGDTDLVLGAPIMDRPDPLLEPVVGNFLGSLVLRVQIPEGSVGAFLDHVRTRCLEAFEDREVPFEQLASLLAKSRDLGRNPIFQVFLSHQAWLGDPGALPFGPGVEITPMQSETDTAKLDLSLAFSCGPTGTQAVLEYRADRFDQRTAELLLAANVAALGELLAASEETPLASIVQTIDAVLRAPTPAPQDAPEASTLLAAIERAVATHGDQTAVVASDGSLTYAALWRAALGCAALRGGARGAHVGVRLRRDSRLIPSLLGTWLRGGAYVPLPSGPLARVARMQALANVSEILADAPAAEIDKGEHDPNLDLRSARAAAGTVCPDDTAYVLFTSGSTGDPKGVEVTHGNLENVAAHFAKLLGLGPGDAWVSITPLTFDIAALELFAPLVAGATVHLVCDDDTRSGASLAAAIQAAKPRVVQSTPSMLRMLIDAQGLGVLRGVTVLVGGEAVTAELARALCSVAARVFNVYGPTETTVWSSAHLITSADVERGLIPIGTPIRGTRIDVVDHEGNPRGIGFAGEIVISGAGVAKGYAGNPTHPSFATLPWGRAYLTKDRGRLRADGTLIFEGRMDRQIKLRGHRIELGDIEAQLEKHPQVLQAAACVEGEGDLATIVAHVAHTEGHAPLEDELRKFLGTLLPEIMVPTWIAVRAHMPQTPNGKVDLAALPLLAPERRDATQTDAEAPQTDTERYVAGLFAALLGAQAAGRDAHFFRLGGHSLVATRLSAQVLADRGRTLPVRAIFEAPTVAGIAAAIEESPVEEGPAGARTLRRRPQRSPTRASRAQERMWVLHRLEPESPAYNMPYAVRVRGALDLGRLAEALSAVCALHPPLRSRFADSEQGLVAEIEEQQAPWALSSRPCTEDELTTTLRDLSRAPFELSRGPLLRVQVLSLAEGDHVLSVVVHHIIADAVSVQLFASQWLRAYAGDLPAPQMPTLDYYDAAWCERVDGEAAGPNTGRTSDLAYWVAELADLDARLVPPDQATRSAVPRGGLQRSTMPKEVVAALKQAAAAQETTVFTLALAALSAVLGDYTASNEVCIGVPVSSRRHIETQEMLGLFVDTLPLRLRRTGHESVAAQVSHARRVLGAALEHSAVSFDEIVSQVAPPRALGQTPFFQALLLVHEAAAVPLPAVPGLAFTPITLSPEAPPFDLTFALTLEDDGAASIHLEYRADLFGEALAASLTRSFERALSSMQSAQASTVAVFEEQQEARIGAPRGTPAPPSVFTSLRRWAAASPQHPAVVSADGSVALTYAELEQRAARLALRLRRAGGDAEHPVRLHMSRRAESIVAVIAAMRAGVPYIPADLSWPAARLLTLGAASLTLDDQGLRDSGGELLSTWAALLEDTGTDATNLEDPQADDTAYIMYTSGSSGVPKGVCVSHKNVSHLADSMGSLMELSPRDRVLQFASLAFDASVEEIACSLTHGATLVLRPEHLGSIRAFLDLAQRTGLTVLDLPTAFFHEFVDLGVEGDFLPSPVRLVVIGGEAAAPDRVARFRRIASDCALMNTYGPTEGTVTSTAWLLPAHSSFEGRVPIGRPIPGVEITVEGTRGVLGVGAVGELVLHGDGVARGYREAVAQGAPGTGFEHTASGTSYRTGDMVRLRHDGVLDFLGRRDRQLKVRGHRVEPQEVERALRETGLVRDAWLVERAGRLVAYVVASEGGSVDAVQLTSALRARFPAAFVPSAITQLPALPRNAAGKVDEAKLPTPDADTETRQPSPPTSDAERELLALFCALLGTDALGIDDDFFAAGGHSLLGTRLLSRIQVRFAVDLPLRTLFEHPTARGLAQELARARPDASRAASIPPRADPKALPLSFAQERLFFLERIDQGSAAFNIPAAIFLEGPLDVEALRAAFETVWHRHDVLRSRFTEESGRPFQHIDAKGPFVLGIEDRSFVPSTEHERDASEQASIEAQRPFDLARGPLVRVRLLRYARGRALLMMTAHHIVVDGWSTSVLLRELAACYRRLRSGERPELPKLPIDYADFATYERARAATGALERGIAHFRDALRGAPELTDIPTDRPRPRVQGHAGSDVPLRFTKETHALVHAMAVRERATPFMVLLSGLHLLLHRLTGDTDTVVGASVAHRTHNDLEGIVGFFVNVLPLRADLSSAQTFEGLVRQTKARTIAAMDHEDVPFDRLVDALEPERSTAHSPIFQVNLVLQNAPAAAFDLPDLNVRSLSVSAKSARFDLIFSIDEGSAGFDGLLTYRTDLWDEETAARFADAFAHLLSEGLRSPSKALTALTAHPSDEATRLLQLGLGPKVPRSLLPITRLLEQRAARRPDDIALRWEARAFSHGELDRQANRIARLLRARGVGPGVVVALALPRGIERVVCLLGVLKAGGAYVPLDERNPGERLARILSLSGAALILCNDATADNLPAGGPQLLVLEEETDALTSLDSRPLEHAPEPHDLAYVLFTSGSSGVPKGVRVPHRGLVNLAVAQAERLALGQGDRVLQVASFGFDASVSEIFMTLHCGATLDLGPAGSLAEEDLGVVLRDRNITSVTLPPTLLGLVNPETLPALRSVISAGEALPPDLARRWVRHVRLFNAYGPTEATVCATMHEVTAADTHRERIPVGTPLPNVDVYVLDTGEQAPVLGAAGEIVLGGIGVALGYVGASPADARRFTSDGRFRTGDQGRWLPDGRLEILGRADEQVKLGGQRVELAEVEHAVMAHADVRAAAACVRDDLGPTPLLVAYVVLHERDTSLGDDTPEGERALEARLRAHARRKLPSYMVPSRIVVLRALPTQESGKVDRRGLPRPRDLAPMAPEAERPMSATEQAIATIIGTLTGRSGITAHDNFFELGGDSITSLQLVARAREQGLLLSAKQVFEHQTVGRIAEVCVPAESHQGAPKDAAMTAHADTYTPTPLQAGMLFESLYADGAPVYVSQLSVGIDGPLDPALLEQAFNAVVARHSALRARFHMGPDGPVAITQSEAHVPFRLVHETSVDNITALAAAEREIPFDLAVAPLMRVVLVQLSRTKHELIWTHHHLCMDGWSVGLVLSEIAEMLVAGPKNQPASLPFEAYAAFVAAQPFAPAERFFGAMLRDVDHKTPLGLPERDGPKGPMQRAAELKTRLTAEVTQALQTLSRKEHVTLNTIVTLAYAEVLARYAGTDDVVFGITMAGRPPELPDIDSAVGLFINTLPIRLRRDVGRSALRELSDLQLVLANLRELSHTPLPKVRALSAVRKGELFDSILVFENFPVAAGPIADSALSLSDLRGAEQTNYPLTIVAAPGPELELRIAYDTDRFEGADVEQLLGRLARLLGAMVNAPQAPLRNVSMASADRARDAARSLQGPASEMPLRPFAERFLAAARTHEHALAVTDLETTQALSYGDLARRAHALALLIRKFGGGAEKPIAICADRGVPLLVAILGAALAGAPFVPLDAMHPLDRLRFQCADAGARMVLCSPACEGLGRAIAPEGAQVVVVPAVQAAKALPPLTAAESHAEPGSAVYVLYTSGSTGRPKGVVALQEGLSNYLSWAKATYGVLAGTTALVHTSVAFDLTITTLLLPLTCGAQVVLAPHGDGIVPLVRGILAAKPMLLKLTPSHAKLLIAEFEGRPQRLGSHLVIGGEALHAETVAALQRIDPSCALYNEYGPTETVVGCVVHKIAGHIQGNVPIGLPIAGTHLEVRDPHGRQVEPGIAGELYIGGRGVCRGYLGRPEETARAFSTTSAGARWYRTGDWVRQRGDLSLEYLGRRDEQIKLHGHRIELGELEALVSRAPGVKQAAAVLVRPEHEPEAPAVLPAGSESDAHLAIFVVPVEAGLRNETVERSLKEDLPAAFLPKQILMVDALPLTVNGKVDRDALARRARAASAALAPASAPEGSHQWSEAEQALARIWQSVLGTAVKSLDDDFFTLGGDSIQSLQIIARAAGVGMRLSPRAIFEHSTLRAMAKVASSAALPTALATTLAIDVGTAPVTPIQAWFFGQGRSRASHYNQSVLLGAKGHMDPTEFRGKVAQVLSAHGLTRTTFVRNDHGWHMVRSARDGAEDQAGRATCVSVVNLAEAKDQARAIEASCDEVQRSFDLERGPLAHVRLMLTREATGDASMRVLLCAHHLVMDAVSMRTLLYELEGALCGRSAPAPRASFLDHARRLRAFATTDTDERRNAAAYYTNLSARALGQLAPMLGPHPWGRSGETRTLRQSIDGVLTKAAGSFVQQRLLTALAAGLAAWNGSETNLVDVEGHGREDLPGEALDLSQTVGWFTSLYPVPLCFSAALTPAQNLQANVQTLAQAPLGGVAFGALAYLGDDAVLAAKLRELRANVSFNFLGRIDTAVSAEGPFFGAKEGRGREEADAEPRTHALEVNAFQLGTQLVVEWTYVSGLMADDEVQGLHDTFARTLLAFADVVPSRQATAAPRRRERTFTDDLIIALKPEGTRPPLVLVHPVGGLVGCYAELSRSLPADLPLYGIQAVGADGADAPLRSIPAMAARYLRALSATFGDDPVVLGGWSMGAMIAMAMAAEPAGVNLHGPLVCLDQTPGEIRRELTDAALLVEIVGDAIPLDEKILAPLSAREQVRLVLAEARARKLPIAGLDEDDVLRHIELCRSNFRALSSFVPARMGREVLLLRAEQRPSWEPITTDPVAEWRDFAEGQVLLRTVPGDHVTMMKAPQVATLALLLSTLIE